MTDFAYIIDPYAATAIEGPSMVFDPAKLATRIKRPEGLAAIYAALSGDYEREDGTKPEASAAHPVSTIDAVRLPDGDVIYVDDNGLLTGGNLVWCMTHPDFSEPLYLSGRGLIVGTDGEGDDTTPQIDGEAIAAMTRLYGTTVGH